MNYGAIKYHDIANGTGVRVSLFVSGCSHHCEGCFNAVAWDYTYGKPFTRKEADAIINACTPNYISGLSILGGEPLDSSNLLNILAFVVLFKIKQPNKTIWLYTGYTWEELTDLNNPDYRLIKHILSYIDILVDGRFDKNLKDISLRFRGSSNQRIIDVQKTLNNKCGLVLMEA